MKKRKLIFATANENKLSEVGKILSDDYELLSLKDIGVTEEIPETKSTLEGNALQKAKFVHDKFKMDCFSEDTGLEIAALNNAPGVFSARYAGEDKSDVNNIALVLKNLTGVQLREARFRTVICLIESGVQFLFEGMIEGKITETAAGSAGFGYDPIFIPSGHSQTFAEMGFEEKIKISHRSRAFEQLFKYLQRVEV
ncbi:MAG: RdgB/HAM1 family non-canonical purine NTP pyrophosphatase [Bacteroidetes bacterium]|nr:RdgB/HAM1 family non-canonical purine NTP pyrophosphatase [Bacteroidota bacterium]